jgi:hypothetical protein
VTFLGLLDSKPSWEPHVRWLHFKFEWSLNILIVLSGQSWGRHKIVMFCLYHALIGSKTDCGSFVYGSAISPNCLTDHVHNTGIRLSTVAFSTSHMLNLHVEPLELPLSVHRIYAAGDPTQASNTQNSILSHGL